MTTIREALDQATRELTQARQQRDLPVENPRLDAQLLLGFVLNKERAYLYAYSEQELTGEQEKCWRDLVARRALNEPVAYLVGQKEFYSLEFTVDKRVLIPRPETELLVEAALAICRQHLDAGKLPVIADIGTGSGAIPISLAVNETRLTRLYGVDISSDALAVARLNCLRYHVEERVHLLQGDLLTPLPEAVDLLLANLPYVGTDEQSSMLPDVLDYEPHQALFSGPEGLDLLQRFLQEARQGDRLRPGAQLLLETGYRQSGPLETFIQAHWPRTTISWLKDYAGYTRILQIKTP